MDIWLGGAAVCLLVAALATSYTRTLDARARHPGIQWRQVGGPLSLGHVVHAGGRVVEMRGYGSPAALWGAALLLLVLSAGAPAPPALLALVAAGCGATSGASWARLRRVHTAWLGWALASAIAGLGAMAGWLR